MITDQSLNNWTIAIPESRELDLFAQMLLDRSAMVVRCPLIAIYDSPNTPIINQWLHDFIASPPDDLIMLTGEGIRRLSGFAERANIHADWVAALSSVRKISRGPKPGKSLRELGLKPDLLASAPTTDGIIATLDEEDLTGRNIAVQLYGEDPNTKLIEFLQKKNANVSAVAPYVYAPDAESVEVTKLIDQLINQDIDILTLTSTPQLKRLISVAKQNDKSAELETALHTVPIAAIGPIVLAQLNELGYQATIAPENQFFMKPLVRKMVEFAANNPR